MQKQEFYNAMEICDIHNQLSDTKNNCYYIWKDADLIFIICDEIEESISVKLLGKISYDFIADFFKKYSDNNIKISDVFDEKDNDNKYVSYVVINKLEDILKFVREMKIYLAKKEGKELIENYESTNIEQDMITDEKEENYNKYKDPYEDPYERKRIGELRSQLPIRGKWAQTVRNYNLMKKKKKQEERRNMRRSF